ncbi:MAG: phenylalanine--tRNA ligase subunit beta, partial [Verrucomicrobia bacterium]|nr:phenylalanine--tRNA ligase subunit beta [Verrucomicrobiota bacterium]
LPALLQVVKGNFAQKNTTLAAFEIGRIHFLQKETATEIPMAAILLTGQRDVSHWSQKPVEVDFFDLKGILENLFHAQYRKSNHLFFHPERQADLYLDDLAVGSFGEVHPRLLGKFDLDQRVYYAEFNLLELLKKKKTHFKMSPLPQFPSSERDLTLPLPLTMPIEQVLNQIHAHRSPLLEQALLIDLYLPDTQDVKNATFRFIYRDRLKTVSFEEVEAEHAKIVQLLSAFVDKSRARG